MVNTSTGKLLGYHGCGAPGEADGRLGSQRLERDHRSSPRMDGKEVLQG
jgi:hypothetical protein